MTGELEVVESAQGLEKAIADAFVNAARTAIAERGRFSIALSGGRTPKAAYALLAAPPRCESVQWPNVQSYFGDERCVPPEHNDSNYKMAFETLLGHVPIPARNIYRMHGEDEPARAARAYAQVLIETLGDPPRFDLMLLGMGPDGHTASLFPGTEPVADDDQLVRAVYVDKLNTHRLTVTPRVINNSRQVIIALGGAEKAHTLNEVLNGPNDPIKYPVQIVDPKNGKLTWLVDRDAAKDLRS